MNVLHGHLSTIGRQTGFRGSRNNFFDFAGAAVFFVVVAIFSPMETEGLAEFADNGVGHRHHLLMDLPPKTHECFHQAIATNSTIFINAKVMEGGRIGIRVRDPFEKVIHVDSDVDDTHYFGSAVNQGDYEVCMGSMNSFGSIRVDLSMIIFNHLQFQIVAEEDQKLTVSHATIRSAIGELFNNIMTSLMHLEHGESHHYKDLRTQQSNGKSVTNFSIFFSLLIVCVSGLQTVFIRRLFLNQQYTPAGKPRA